MPFLRAAACLAQPTVNLALQGGGAHGAFTWGVLDALLEDGRVAFDGISGTSAGAMNAVALADGWMRGGREGARQALAGFWQEVAQRWQRSQPGLGLRGSDAPWNRMLRQWASSFSPYELNPLGHDPLREVVQACFDFERLRRESPFRLYIAATEVRTGRLQLFREGELDASRLLASACLPTLQHAV
ncbi:MAG: patatin-like phospholipase family protein, partial [Aquabacterium sp.]